MKKQNNKGFTLVELVIVIAVIAILAGVLIGTFATVICNTQCLCSFNDGTQAKLHEQHDENHERRLKIKTTK